MRGRAASIRTCGEGLTLGAGTMLAGMGRDECGRPRHALDDEPRALALLATAYDRPVEACFVAKLRRACERWTEGEKALAHIHLAHAGVPPCGPDQALRLFVADELIEAGVAPRILMTAQGFDPATLDLLKANFNQAQPRWPAGSGRDSGRWSGGASVDSAGVKEFIARLLLEAARRAARALRPSETKPPKPEVVSPRPSPFVRQRRSREFLPQNHPTLWVRTLASWEWEWISRNSVFANLILTLSKGWPNAECLPAS
jgi:hypothetical protein